MANSFDFTDSFSHVSTLAQLITKWTRGGLALTVGGNVGASFAIGAASQGYRANNNYIGVPIPQGPSRKFGFRFRTNSLGFGGAFWYEPAGLQLQITTDTSGHVIVKRNNTTIATSTLTININTIYYIAVEVTINSTTGVFNLFVNGVSYLAFVGNTQATANAFIDSFGIGCSGGAYDYGDVIVYPSAMTTILDATVQPYKVNSAGARTVFSRGGIDLGTNWQQVSKALAAITNFNFSNVVGDRDNFTMDPVPAVGTLLGARLYEYGQKDGSGLRSIALTVENGASDDVGADTPLTQNGYGFYGRDASLDPATAALWASFAALNGAKMGYKVTV